MLFIELNSLYTIYILNTKELMPIRSLKICVFRLHTSRKRCLNKFICKSQNKNKFEKHLTQKFQNMHGLIFVELRIANLFSEFLKIKLIIRITKIHKIFFFIFWSTNQTVTRFNNRLDMTIFCRRVSMVKRMAYI